MTPRAGETADEFNARRRAARPSQAKEWRTIRRTKNAEGAITGKVQIPDTPKVEAPAGMVPIKVSSLEDGEGNSRLTWRQYAPERRDPETVCRILADELAKPLPRVAPIAFEAYNGQIVDHLMACYPVGDHHLGMLSWKPETGADYDISIAEKLLTDAFNHLIPRSPKCERAAVVFLGDFFHYDSPDPVTPKSKHQLAADSRWPKMVRAGLRTMRRQIEALALWHHTVEVIVEPGNHDPYSSVFLAEALANIYDANPRITVDTSPQPFHYIRFEKNLIGTHHGDLVKPARLLEVMTADRAKDWGETEYRTWWTGHVHSRHADDIGAMAWESFRILAPADGFAHRSGYRSIRNQHAIMLHADGGEFTRYTVNPAMLEKK